MLSLYFELLHDHPCMGCSIQQLYYLITHIKPRAEADDLEISSPQPKSVEPSARSRVMKTEDLMKACRQLHLQPAGRLRMLRRTACLPPDCIRSVRFGSTTDSERG